MSAERAPARGGGRPGLDSGLGAERDGCCRRLENSAYLLTIAFSARSPTQPHKKVRAACARSQAQCALPKLSRDLEGHDVLNRQWQISSALVQPKSSSAVLQTLQTPPTPRLSALERFRDDYPSEVP